MKINIKILKICLSDCWLYQFSWYPRYKVNHVMKKYQFLSKSILVYISPLHVIVIIHHYCADRLNPDRFGAGSFFKQAPVFVVTVANSCLYK